MNVARPAGAGAGADDDIDAQIAACLGLTARRSFFLFAGAGSGKTRSLVTALQHVQTHLGEPLRLRGQRVGVITYTNAACDEIKRRLRSDPLVDVRTIHSFAWALIENLTNDIRERLRVTLANEVLELQAKEQRGRKGNASLERIAKIKAKTERLRHLDEIPRFRYSPTGADRSRESLAHAEVIQLASHFLTTKAAMRAILVGRYPILLIDESQDTNKFLVDALLSVQAEQKDRFAIGLIGDMMQRIYFDGSEGLGQGLASDWAVLGKRLNHRCPKRVVALINKVRETADGSQQVPRPDAQEGLVRFFILSGSGEDKANAEQQAADRMAKITGDEEWARPDSVKTLTLEHRMAARRLGILEVFEPLHRVERWRQSLFAGTLPAAAFFTKIVLPLVSAARMRDRFATTRIVKEHSPLMTGEAIEVVPDKKEHLRRVSTAVDKLMTLWEGGVEPTLRDVVRMIASSGLLDIPESLRGHESAADRVALRDSGAPEVESETESAIAEFLDAPFSQVEPLAKYLSGEARFDTHHGVKGLEFERVMVVMDDDEARGFLFKYDSLFGGKPAGDKTVEATRRLFYVTCSRAKRSLALVAHTSSPERVREFVLSQAWFTEDEVVVGL